MAHGRAAQLPHALVGDRKQVLAVEQRHAAGDATWWGGHEAHDRHGGDRLAGAGFADDAEALSLAQPHVDAADRPEDLAAI